MLIPTLGIFTDLHACNPLSETMFEIWNFENVKNNNCLKWFSTKQQVHYQSLHPRLNAADDAVFLFVLSFSRFAYSFAESCCAKHYVLWLRVHQAYAAAPNGHFHHTSPMLHVCAYSYENKSASQRLVCLLQTMHHAYRHAHTQFGFCFANFFLEFFFAWCEKKESFTWR